MDRPDISRLCPGSALSSCHPKTATAPRLTPRVLPRVLPRILVLSLAVALAACASRGGDQVVDGGNAAWTGDLSDDATDEAGEFVVNQALLRQARDELAVLSQPATGTYLETLSASRAPRSVNDPTPSAAAPAASSSSRGAQTWADLEGDKGQGAIASTASTPATPAFTPTTSAEAAQADQASRVDPATQAVDAATQAELTTPADPAAEGQRPGLFGRVFGWFRSNPDEAATAAGAVTGAGVAAEGAADATTADATSAATAAAAATAATATTTAATPATAATAADATATAAPRPGPPGPGEPGYIVSGHSSGAMRLAVTAAPESAALSAPVQDAVTSPVATRSNLAEVEAPAVAPVVIAATSTSRPSTGNVIVTPIGASGQSGQAGQAGQSGQAGQAGAESPALMAAVRQPAPPATPSFADVPPLDRNLLERGSFATLMGAMHGMVERCEPATQMREQALKTYRATYPVVDLDRNERDSPTARLRVDEDFARSAAATLGSDRVNCDYVRSQSYGWNQLVGDLRHMNRDSARQYRPGLITEIARGAGLGNL